MPDLCYPPRVQLEPRTLEGALAGDIGAIRALVAHLTPVIHARVARALLRGRAGSRNRDLNEEVTDLTQDVFLSLFADGATLLRAWDPARGLSLTNFVGLVAERQATSAMRSGRKNPFREKAATYDELVEQSGTEAGPAPRVESRILFDTIVVRLKGELSAQGQRIFALLFIEERSVEAIGTELGMTADAVYAWRSRLLKTVRRLMTELESEKGLSETGGSPRSSDQSARDD
jgi:RNA polymerase sigma-70 factor (ECF subfamily)